MRAFVVLVVLPAVVFSQAPARVDVIPALKGATYIGESGGVWIWVTAQPNGNPVVALRSPSNRTAGTGSFLLSFGSTLDQPVFAYSTGLRMTNFMGLKSDAQGRIHVLGGAESVGQSPGISNQFGCRKTGADAFVAQINGSTRATEYIDCIPVTPRSIAVDAAGSTYILGEAPSSTLPRVGGLRDATGPSALIKYSPSGKVQFSTYLYGGANQMGVDAAGTVYVAGSSTVPVEKMAGVLRAGCAEAPKGNFDAFRSVANGGRREGTVRTANVQPACGGFIQKISANGDQVLATVLVPTFGGSGGRLAVAPDGTYAWLNRSLTCLNPNGSLRFSSEPIYPQALALEFGPNQDIYMTSREGAASLPLVHSMGQAEPAGRYPGRGPLLTRVSGSDGRIVYSTLLGPASSGAWPTSLAFAAPNTVYVAGYGASMPVMGRQYKAYAPGADAFLLQIAEGAADRSPATCEYSISPPTASFPRHGGTANLVISASRGDCPSDFQSEQSWLRVTSPPSGTGVRRLIVQADANVGAAARKGVIRFGQLQIPIEQAGPSPR